MARDNFYFPHESNARNDIKLVKVRIKYGMEGYGIYFAIIEMLRENDNYEISEDDIPTIAFIISSDAAKVNDIIRNFGLFRFESGCFYSQALTDKMQEYEKRKEAARAAGVASGKKRQENKLQVNNNPTTVEQPLNECLTDVEPPLNIKVNESKGDNSKVKDSSGMPSATDTPKRIRKPKIIEPTGRDRLIVPTHEEFIKEHGFDYSEEQNRAYNNLQITIEKEKPELNNYKKPLSFVEYLKIKGEYIETLHVNGIVKKRKTQEIPKSFWWDNYCNALSLGGTKTLPQLYETAGLKFDFSSEQIKVLMEFVKEEM